MVTPDKKINSNSAEVVRSFIATWNTHDTSAILDLLDPDIVFRSPLFSSPLRGLEERKGEIVNVLTSMPDFKFKLIGIASEGDFVATELVGSGTSTGPAMLPGPVEVPLPTSSVATKSPSEAIPINLNLKSGIDVKTFTISPLRSSRPRRGLENKGLRKTMSGSSRSRMALVS